MGALLTAMMRRAAWVAALPPGHRGDPRHCPRVLVRDTVARFGGQPAVGRLESIEPIVPAETVREGRGGRLEILAWQGEPEAHLLCSREGGLRLRSVEVSAWQAVDLARKWDDPRRKPDTGTAKQLRELFARVRTALQAWVELTDHLLHAR